MPDTTVQPTGWRIVAIFAGKRRELLANADTFASAHIYATAARISLTGLADVVVEETGASA